MKKCSLLLLALCMVSLLAACGPSSTVNLISPEVVSSPTSHAPVVALLNFENNRSSQALGVRADGSQFNASDSVSVWFSKNLINSLNQGGMHVVQINNITEASSVNADYVLTGALDEVWIKENSRTNMSGRIRATYKLTRGDVTVAKEALRCERENGATLFSSSAASKLADELINDFSKLMLDKLRAAVR